MDATERDAEAVAIKSSLKDGTDAQMFVACSGSRACGCVREALPVTATRLDAAMHMNLG